PLFLRKRLLRFKDFSWIAHFKNFFFTIIISIIIGTVSHIVLDGFTHRGGKFVKEFETLKDTFVIAGHSVPTYTILQHLGTLVGGLIVIYGLIQLPADKSITEKKNIFPYWFLVGLFTIIALGIRLLLGLNIKHYEDLIVTAISGWLLGIILTPLLLPAKYR
ncbi:MAG TPA: DUF4184 family protein, partial [Chitinophagaceae bacterium]|nr:DUF4184 family protein [Chitinophagaceae bacterium]